LAWPRHDEQSSPRPIVTYDHPVTATAAGVTPRRPAVRAGLSILSLTPAEPSPDARDEGPKRRNGEARERVSRVKTALDPETAPNEDAAQPAAAAPDEGIVSALALVAETPAADPPRPRGQGWRWSHSGILLTALACVVLGPTVLPFKSSARERVHRRRRGDGEGDKSEMVPRLTEAQ
ncbi:MAG: hypothetical protein CMJ18_03455, partial [Phycisphaeraceae bacterium]|nr:hypothetical protein [Phycisphaeraceae bacterium]